MGLESEMITPVCVHACKLYACICVHTCMCFANLLMVTYLTSIVIQDNACSASILFTLRNQTFLKLSIKICQS